MSIVIGRLEFEGPIKSPDNLKNEPGIYGVVTHNRLSANFLLSLHHTHSVSTKIGSRQLPGSEGNEIQQGRKEFLAVFYTPGLDAAQRQMICEDIVREEAVSAPKVFAAR